MHPFGRWLPSLVPYRVVAWNDSVEELVRCRADTGAYLSFEECTMQGGDQTRVFAESREFRRWLSGS
jgi:hypothetical protein